MINNNRAMMGESMLMIYRILLITIIALVVLGCSAFFYDYYLSVRDTEAVIMSKEVANCIVNNSFIDLVKLKGQETNILDYCKIKNVDRFYVKINILDISGNSITTYSQGDSGSIWVKKIVDSNSAYFSRTNVDKLLKYDPGYSLQEYDVLFLQKDVENKDILVKGKLKMEVFVSNEI